MYTKPSFIKTSLKKVITFFSFLLIASTITLAQDGCNYQPNFEIHTVQDGSENGAHVIYIIKMTDAAGRNLVNTTSKEILLDIEFGVDSDVERSDMATAFPSSISILPGSGGTTVRLEILNDGIRETSESLVAMIYNPSIGAVSDTNSYATATVVDAESTLLAFKQTY